MKSIWMALVLALVAACGGSEDPEVDACPGPVPDPVALRVELGAGLDEFVPLVDRDRVMIIEGAQGGFHIWTAVRVWGLDDPRPTIALSAKAQATGADVGAPSRVRVQTRAFGTDGAQEVSGLFSFIDDPGPVRGVPVVLRVEVSGCGGGRGSDERVVIPR